MSGACSRMWATASALSPGYERAAAYSKTRVSTTSSDSAIEPESNGGWGSYSIVSWAARSAPQRIGLPKRITFPSGSVMEPSRLP